MQKQFKGVGYTNKEIESKIDYIYDRQREVNIGKRNINCLSCSVEPEDRVVQGNDGKVYRGKSPLKTQEDQELERAKSKGSSDGKKARLLNLKWDNIGL